MFMFPHRRTSPQHRPPARDTFAFYLMLVAFHLFKSPIIYRAGQLFRPKRRLRDNWVASREKRQIAIKTKLVGSNYERLHNTTQQKQQLRRP